MTVERSKNLLFSSFEVSHLFIDFCLRYLPFLTILEVQDICLLLSLYFLGWDQPLEFLPAFSKTLSIPHLRNSFLVSLILLHTLCLWRVFFAKPWAMPQQFQLKTIMAGVQCSHFRFQGVITSKLCVGEFQFPITKASRSQHSLLLVVLRTNIRVIHLLVLWV